jgi:hypothetical protein|tara:strand:+ start:939 stop:1565 length:627 start_codon:yes stop_codon:yes gene_type:complete
MTISHDKKYIFIRVFKTGSMSIGRHIENNDSRIRVTSNGLRYSKPGVPDTTDWSKETLHIKSSWIKENIFSELGLNWDEYFKFGFVRNPWDRELSNYFYNMGARKPPKDISFKEWLNNCLIKDGQIDASNSPQSEYLTDVDYIARFENYNEEVEYIFDKIDIPILKSLMHINKTDHKPYWKYYDYSDAMKVYGWYKKDIEMYNYEFGD